MINEQRLMGIVLLSLIKRDYIDKKRFAFISDYFKAQQIKDAESFLNAHKTTDFLTNDAAAFELINIFLNDFQMPAGYELLLMDTAQFQYDDFSCSRAHYVSQDNELLGLFNNLCKKLFRTAQQTYIYKDYNRDVPESDRLEIETLMYFQRTPFFTEGMFRLLRRMPNPKAGVIALKILNESGINITLTIKNLLCSTIQPANLARVLHYVNLFGGLNDRNIGLLATTIQAWESWQVGQTRQVKSIEYDSGDDRGVESIVYLHKMKILAMFLQSLSLGGILTQEKFDFLMNPGIHYLLEDREFFDLLNQFSSISCGFSSIMWDNFIVHPQQNNAAVLNEKMYRLNCAFHQFTPAISPIIVAVLLHPENNVFTFSACLTELSLIMKRFSSNMPVSYQHVLDLVQILREKDAHYDPDRLENYLASIGIGDISVKLIIENDQHVKNIQQIKIYLTCIGFLTSANETEISETLVDPDYTNLFTLTFDGKSLASQMALIPGDLFIQHNVWQRFLGCCIAGNSREAFEYCFADMITITLAQAHETGFLKRNTLNHFEQLSDIISVAKSSELAYRAKSNSLSHSIAYKKPNFSTIEGFFRLIQQEKAQEAADWLKDNQQELQKGMFGGVLANKLAEIRPFDGSNLAELQDNLAYLAAANNATDMPQKIFRK